MLALDAVGHPDPQAVKDSGALFIARYVPSAYQHYGITRDQLNAYRDAGVSVLPIFEEWESQFLGGRQGAVAHIGRMLKGCETLGITPGADFIPAVATVDPRPGDVNGHEGLLQEYAAGIDDTLGLPEWTGYGSAYGFKVIADGGAAAHMTRRWGVGTWGFGEKPDGSLPDPLPAPADMIQHGNLGYVNVGGVDCDPNTVFRSDMGQWPRPAPPHALGGEMLYTIDQQTFYAYVPAVGFLPATTYSGLGWLQIDQATYDRMSAAANVSATLRAELDRTEVKRTGRLQKPWPLGV